MEYIQTMKYAALILLIGLILVSTVGYCNDRRSDGRILALQDSIQRLHTNNQELRTRVDSVDTEYRRQVDSLEDVTLELREDRREARTRAGHLEQQLREMIPDTAQAVLDSLLQQMEEERQSYEAELLVERRRVELLEGRVVARDSLIAGLEAELAAEREFSNYWKRRAQPSFLERLQNNAVLAGGALLTGFVVAEVIGG